MRISCRSLFSNFPICCGQYLIENKLFSLFYFAHTKNWNNIKLSRTMRTGRRKCDGRSVTVIEKYGAPLRLKGISAELLEK